MRLVKLILIGTAAAALACAQGGMGGAGGGMGGGGGGSKGGGGGDMGASMGPAHVTRLDRMTDILKLSKDEKKSVKGIMDDGEKQAGPVREQMMKTRLAIADAVAAGKPQADIDAAVKAYAEATVQMTNIELTSFAKIYTGLDRDQQVKSVPGVLQMMAGVFKTKNWNE